MAQVLDVDVRDVAVSALTAPLVLGTPQVWRARNAREFRALQGNPEAAPAAAREFSRAERLLIRVPAFGADAAPVNARLLSRLGVAMRDLPLTTGEDGSTREVDLPLAGFAVGDYVSSSRPRRRPRRARVRALPRRALTPPERGRGRRATAPSLCPSRFRQPCLKFPAAPRKPQRNPLGLLLALCPASAPPYRPMTTTCRDVIQHVAAVLFGLAGLTQALDAETLLRPTGVPVRVQLSRDLQRVAAKMIARSPTFRSQLDRLESADGLIVTAHVDLTIEQRSYRARSVIRRLRTGEMVAVVASARGAAPWNGSRTSSNTFSSRSRVFICRRSWAHQRDLAHGKRGDVRDRPRDSRGSARRRRDARRTGALRHSCRIRPTGPGRDCRVQSTCAP